MIEILFLVQLQKGEQVIEVLFLVELHEGEYK